MKKYLFKTAVLPVIIIAFSFCTSSAQPVETTTTTTSKTLTAKDKEVIIEIFNTIHSSLYKFQFSKEESYGSKNVSPMAASELRSGKKVNFPNSISETYFPQVNFWFAVSMLKSPADKLEGLFGKANAARLQAIINKYIGGNSNK